MEDKIEKSDGEWKSELSPEEFHITREKGTERAFTGKYWDFHGEGVYRCVCCGSEIFESGTKFDSGSGWPSFYEPISDEMIEEDKDLSLGMTRKEIKCSKCGAHLGHVFDDGPDPTGLRYCVNSASLKFVGKKDVGHGGQLP